MRLRWGALILVVMSGFAQCTLPSTDEFSSCPGCKDGGGEQGDATSALDGQPSTDGGGSDGNGFGDTASNDAPSDAPVFDSVGQIACGVSPCALVAKVCCADTTFVCELSDAACPTFRLECDDRTDCVTSTFPTPICCLPLNDAGNPSGSSACHGYNYCLNNNAYRAILCDPNGVEPCPPDSGTTCKPLAAARMNGYSACQ